MYLYLICLMWRVTLFQMMSRGSQAGNTSKTPEIAKHDDSQSIATTGVIASHDNGYPLSIEKLSSQQYCLCDMHCAKDAFLLGRYNASNVIILRAVG